VPSGLSNFYRDAILAVKKMDTKYKESIPEIIRNVALVLSDDESRRKKRKSKKKKLGKNGLYSEEDGFIRKWWKDRQLAENAVSADVSRQEEAKRHISDLRLRETQLQILLILETISLEASEGARNGADQAQDEQGSGPKKQRSKKAQDLNVLLELFLDRLCIWHAVSFEDAVVPDSIQESAENHLSGKKIESDMLRDFCTEVIIPFYASRLPEQCKSIKKKLGGPNDISPARPTPQSKPSSRPQPGAAIKRPQPPKQRRTLQRVLTDERAAASHRARQPSLARSSTAPSVQEIKRESVEPSLPSLSGSVRGGIQVARRVDNREVDLNAVAKQHGAKMKKMNIMMKQKKELDAAISALRKPNRELVSKEVAEHAEKRVTSSSARKPKNPVRNPFGQGVQVMATPKGSRKKDISVALPQPRGLARPSMRRADTSPALGSDLSIVPASSTVRPSVSSSAGERREVNSIHETPSRGLSKITDPLQSMIEEAADTPQNAECSRTLFKIPTLPAPRSNDEQQHISTPVRSHLFSSSRTTELPDAGMQETPPRSSSTNLLAIPSSPFPVLDTPVKGGQKRVHTITTPEKSIYDQLGWDDDDLACSL
jgi:DNA replication regulator SLD3